MRSALLQYFTTEDPYRLDLRSHTHVYSLASAACSAAESWAQQSPKVRPGKIHSSRTTQYTSHSTTSSISAKIQGFVFLWTGVEGLLGLMVLEFWSC